MRTLCRYRTHTHTTTYRSAAPPSTLVCTKLFTQCSSHTTSHSSASSHSQRRRRLAASLAKTPRRCALARRACTRRPPASASPVRQSDHPAKLFFSGAPNAAAYTACRRQLSYLCCVLHNGEIAAATARVANLHLTVATVFVHDLRQSECLRFRQRCMCCYVELVV